MVAADPRFPKHALGADVSLYLYHGVVYIDVIVVLVHRENKEYQEKTGLLTPRTGMHRLIREVAGHHKDIRIAACAVDAIHQVAENYLINRFQAANVCCHHGRRVTVMQKDFKLSEEIICTLGHWAKAMGSKSV